MSYVLFSIKTNQCIGGASEREKETDRETGKRDRQKSPPGFTSFFSLKEPDLARKQNLYCYYKHKRIHARMFYMSMRLFNGSYVKEFIHL